MTTFAPVSDLTLMTGVDSLTATAETYAALTDELAAAVEVSDIATTTPGQLVAHRLAALALILDGLTTRQPNRADLVALANQVLALRDFAADREDEAPAYRTLLNPLAELHAALIDQVLIAQVTA